ncbi:MAG: hypothetical protein OEZ36_14585, partial [Spirochaetota bacterium]|nr:hypothetical protein [Spirochaetota bacterium]
MYVTTKAGIMSFIIIPMIFSGGVFSQSPGDRQAIDLTVRKINSMALEKLHLDFGGKNAIKEADIYRNRETKRIRRIDYIEYSDWYYLESRQYYNKDGKLIYILCNNPARIYYETRPDKKKQAELNKTVYYPSTEKFMKEMRKILRMYSRFEEDHALRGMYDMSYKKLESDKYWKACLFVSPTKG